MNSDDQDLINITSIQRRTLIQEIKSILHQYSDDSQIFKEIIQNAEDAKATELIFLYDQATYNSSQNYSADGLGKYQGPALLVYNNALFEKEDWIGIVSLGVSGKVKQPLKVGRFGLGFKSIFHLTDMPFIMSGDYLAYVDPLKETFLQSNNQFKEVNICRLRTQFEDYNDEFLWYPSLPADICPSFPQYYNGTLFRFPLRQNQSDISGTSYNDLKMQLLIDTFRKEGFLNMLFLKNIKEMSFYTINEERMIKKIYSINRNDVEQSYEKQQIFLQDINNCVKNGLYHPSSQDIDLSLKEMDYINKTEVNKRYVLSEYFGHCNNDSDFIGMIQDADLSYLPLIGIAYPLQIDDVTGHIYCGLPLPFSEKSLTGLPVHINGYFALSQDRKDLKWKSTSLEHSTDKTVLWNELMIKNCLPEVFLNLLKLLICSPNIYSSDIIYNIWPNEKNVAPNWKPFLNSVWEKISKMKCIYLKQENKWMHPNEVVILRKEQFSTDSQFHVLLRFFQTSQFRITSVPVHIYSVLKRYYALSLKSDYLLMALSKMPQQYQQCLVDEQNEIIKYVLSKENAIKILNKFPLIRLMDGTYGVFNGSSNKLFLPTDICHKELFIGNKNIVDFEFYDEASFAQMKKLCELDLQMTLFENSCTVGKTNLVLLDSYVKVIDVIKSFSLNISYKPDKNWVDKIWEYYRKEAFNLSYLEDLPIIPVEGRNGFKYHKLSKENKAMLKSYNKEKLSDTLIYFLSAIGVDSVTNDLPLHALRSIELQNYVFLPTNNGVVQAIKNKSIFGYNFDKHLRAEFLYIIENVTIPVPENLYTLPLFKEIGSDDTYISCKDCYLVNEEEIPPNWQIKTLVSESSVKLAVKVKLRFNKYSHNELAMLFFQDVLSLNEKQNSFFIRILSTQKNVPDKMLTKLSERVYFYTKGGQKRNACDLFVPSTELKQLFYYEDNMFPICDFDAVKTLHFKTVKDINTSHIKMNISVIHFNNMSMDLNCLVEKVNLILHMCSYLQIDLQKEYSSLNWIPVETEIKVNHGYPTSLSWCKGPDRGGVVVKPLNEVFSTELAYLVGSTSYIVKSTIKRIDIFTKNIPLIKSIFDHLKNIEQCYNEDEKGIYKEMIYNVYKYLIKVHPSNAIATEWTNHGLKVWNVDRFVDCNQLLLHPVKINLEPYFYVCQEAIKTILGNVLLKICNSYSEINIYIVMLQILHKTESENYYEKLRLSVELINILADEFHLLNEDEKSNIYVPLDDPHQLRLGSIKECFYHDFNGNLNIGSYNIVNRSIKKEVVDKLKIPNLVSEILSNENEIFEEWGQKEPLTLRINRLLNNYVDGLGVFKELIQNAEDAGASEVSFLYDQRKNDNLKSLLINPAMSSWQGPALWVYNDAKFTEQDFINITKLNSGTKEQNTEKIGKFGLGFNSVYHLTDLPSFLSGEHLVIFDPHQKFLGGGLKSVNHTGQRIQFKSSTNFAPFKNQFEVFNGIFGCTVDCLNSGLENYPGTLFRLPLRNEEMAEESEIKKLSYSYSEMKLLSIKLKESLNNLLLFTENVKKVSFYQMSANDEYEKLFCVNKEIVLNFSPSVVENILVEATIALNKTVYGVPDKPKICAERVIKMVTDNGDNTHTQMWLLNLFIGSKITIEFAQNNKGLVPCGGVALAYNDNNSTVVVENSAQNIFFCFLPLPISSNLPVCLNGAFTVTNDRKQFYKDSKDNKRYGEIIDWNCILASDIGYAYYELIVLFIKRYSSSFYNINISNFQSLFPKDLSLIKNDSIITAVMQSLARAIIEGKSSIIPYHDFNIPSHTLRKNWGNIKIIPISLQILSDDICAFMNWYYVKHEFETTCINFDENILELLTVYGQNEAVGRAYLVEEDLYNYFFQSINEKTLNCNIRDSLMIFLLNRTPKAGCFFHYISTIPCIPTVPNGKLCLPCDLVEKESFVSQLYVIEDEVFPECAYENHLPYLISLGMSAERLSWEKIVLNALKLQKINTIGLEKKSEILLTLIERALSKHVPDPKDVSILLDAKFLPVMKKPPISKQVHWYSKSLNLSSPKETYPQKYKNIVSASAAIIDIQLSNKMRCFLTLNKEPSLDHVTRMFTEVQEMRSLGNCCDEIEHIIDCLLKYLNEKFESNETLGYTNLNVVIYTNNDKQLVIPQKMYFKVEKEISGFLYEVPKKLQTRYQLLLQFFGVKDAPCLTDYVSILKSIYETHLRSPVSKELIQSILHIIVPKICLSINENNELDIYVPSTDNVMYLASTMCYVDTPWLKHDDTATVYVHEDISYSLASKLGVRNDRKNFLSNKCQSFAFGQHEDLSTRIKNLLKGYSKSDVLKELIQNADDAKATEVMFILDKRIHDNEKVFSKEWKEVQGPAILAVNNGIFSEYDLASLQKLGSGSKKGSALKTGRFGVGFNAVYNITDCPTLIADLCEKKERDFCIFDPLLKYKIGGDELQPGRRFNFNDIKKYFPDVVLAHCIDMFETFPGTIFRLPLRTSSYPSLSYGATTPADVESMFKQMMLQVRESLLFLLNIKKITFKVISKDNDCKTNVFIAQRDIPQERYRRSELLEKLSLNLKSNNSLSSLMQQYSYKVSVSHYEDNIFCCSRHWNVEEQCGFATNISIENINLNQINLIPRGNVAVPVKAERFNYEKKKRCFLMSPIKSNYNLFCTLPIPVNSYLPVIINGTFALEYETRHHLWAIKNTPEWFWNIAIIIHCVLPCYINYLMKYHCFNYNQPKTIKASKSFYEFFPKDVKPETYWGEFGRAFYVTLHKKDLPLLSVRQNSIPGKKEMEMLSIYTCKTKSEFIIYGVDSCNRNNKIKLLSILQDIGVPIELIEHFVEENFKKVECNLMNISPINILNKLTDLSTTIINHSQIKVEDTRYKDVESVEIVAKYCLEGANFEIEGAPLCVLADGTLNVFKQLKPKYLTRHVDIFPTLQHKFIHPALYTIFEKYEQKKLWFKPFNISDFFENLETEKSQYNGNVDMMVLSERDCIEEKWLEKVWRFICSFDIKDILSQLESYKTWLLLLCQSKGEKYLLQLKDRKCVLNLSRENDEFEKSLRNIPVFEVIQQAKLGDKKPFYKAKFSASFFGDVNHVSDLVNALHYSSKHSCCNFDKKLIQQVISRLSMNHVTDKIIIQKLKELPLFFKYDGTTTSLTKPFVMLPDDKIPHEGLSLVESEFCIIILSKQLELIKIFDLKECNVNDFYMKYVIKLLSTLSFTDILKHLHYLKLQLTHVLYQRKENICIKDQNILSSLSNVNIIQTRSGTLKSCIDLYDPNVELFKLMFDDNVFPCEAVKMAEWKQFLIHIGLKYKVTENDFFKYAKLIEQMSDDSKGRKLSELLCKEIINYSRINQQVLYSLKNVKFLYPDEPEKCLLKIFSSYNSTCNKVCYNGSVTNADATVVWTTKYILPIYSFHEKLVEICEIKCSKDRTISTGDIIKHIENITKTLETICNKKTLKYIPTEFRKTYERVFKDIYNQLKNIKLQKNDIIKLSELSFILVQNNEWFDVPKKVVFQDEFSLPPYVNKVDVQWGAYFDFFKTLGCHDKSTAEHFILALDEIFAEYQENILPPNHVHCVTKAMKYLGELLKTGGSLSDFKGKLYLLSISFKKEKKRKHFQLTSSSELVLINDFRLEERLSTLNRKILPLKYTDELDCDDKINYNLVKYLPDHLKPLLLTDILKEKLVEPLHVLDFNEDDGHLACSIKQQLYSSQFANGVTRLVNYGKDSHNKLVEIGKIQDIFKYTEIYIVQMIETCLEQDGSVVDKSSQAKDCYVSANENGLKIYLSVFAEASNKSIFNLISNGILQFLDKNDYVITDRMAAIFLTQILELPLDQIESFLDKGEVSRSCSTNSTDYATDVPLGELVPLELYHLLDNGFDELMNGEYVALCHGDEDEEVYVYARIIECISSADETFKKYKVQLTNDEINTNEIQGLLLYRFRPVVIGVNETKMDDEKTATSGILVVEDGKDIIDEEKKPGGINHESDVFDTKSLDEIMKEIENIFKDCILFDEKQKKKVFRRLYLKWHPDKHPPNRQVLATKVFQFIQQKIKLDDKNLIFQNWSSTAQQHNCDRNQYSNYFRQRYSSKNNNFSAPPSFKKKNPQPAVAKRWFRQAIKDRDAATQSTSYEWVCYMAKQACEKALKAAIFNEDHSYFTCHDLNILALKIENPEIRSYSKEFEKLVISSQHLLYPDKWCCPTIPHDKYDEIKGMQAVRISNKVLNIVAELINFVHY